MAHLFRFFPGVAAVLATALLVPSSSLAANPKTAVSPHLREKREQLRQVKKELDQKRKQAKQVAQKERALSDELHRLDQELRRKERALKDLRAMLRVRTGRLQATQRDITLTQTHLERIQKLFRRRLRAIYKQGRYGYVQALASSEDLSGAERRIRYLATIAHQDRQMVAAYTATIETLGAQRAELARSKAELTMNEKAIRDTREEIVKEQQARRVLLTKVQDEKKGHLAAARELELAAKELQRLIGRLQQQKRPQIGKAPRRIPSHTINPKEPGGSFASLKGHLPWPTAGVLASTFGRQEHARYKTVTFNHGIEINASEGQKIVSVAAGVVLYADWFKGYGRLIVVDHGEGYYTVYAHAAEILVKAGDQVAKKQTIGLVGASGSANGSQLYFEVRYRGGPQDPVVWLAPM